MKAREGVLGSDPEFFTDSQKEVRGTEQRSKKQKKERNLWLSWVVSHDLLQI
jgi:hypothetical protein